MAQTSTLAAAGNIPGRSAVTADEQLMLRVAAGDDGALGLLYDRHARKLYNYFLRRLGQAERAEELTHDVFVALLGLRERYRASAPFVALLYGIARNLLGKEYRRWKKHRQTSLDEASLPAPAGPDLELGLAVRQALERLDKRFREPLMLSVYEQLSYEEIAAVLGRPIGTVRSRISRAKRQLATTLLEERNP